MTAHKTGTKLVLLGTKMRGDEGKDIQRNTVYANERVPPLADIRQCDRNVPVELRNIIEDKVVEEVSVSSFKIASGSIMSMIFRNVRWRVRRALQLLVQGKDEPRKRQALSRVSTCVHGRWKIRWEKSPDFPALVDHLAW